LDTVRGTISSENNSKYSIVQNVHVTIYLRRYYNIKILNTSSASKRDASGARRIYFSCSIVKQERVEISTAASERSVRVNEIAFTPDVGECRAKARPHTSVIHRFDDLERCVVCICVSICTARYSLLSFEKRTGLLHSHISDIYNSAVTSSFQRVFI